MDLSSGFDIPNPYGLLASDFGFDVAGYRAALGFLGDLASGTEHDRALAANGGSLALLTGWKGSPKFRRVYAKCLEAARTNTERPIVRQIPVVPVLPPSGQQRFIPVEEVPRNAGPFTSTPAPTVGL
ncbi:MAG: hypothetical protein JO130_18505 [Solirubrobacterales bacterium]|nr:hypothetical protein [Solirubrobacterales bacterium]